MNKTGSLFLTQMKRGKFFMLISLMVGIILCPLFYLMTDMMTDGSAVENGVPVGVLDHDNTALSTDFMIYLIDEQGMIVQESKDYDTLSAALIDRKIAAIIEIPDGFHRGAQEKACLPLEVTYLDDYENAVFMNSYIETYMASVEILSAGADGDDALFDEMLQRNREEIISINTQPVVSSSDRQAMQREAFLLCFGFFIMISSYFAIGVTNMVLDDRKQGTYQRIQIGDLRPVQYVFSICAFGFLNSLIMMSAFFSFIYVMGFDIGMPLWAPFAFACLYTLFVVAFSLVLGLNLQSKSSVMAAIVGVGTIGSILGGIFFPISIVPEGMQQFARLAPHFWVIDALRKIGEEQNYNVGLNVAVLLLFSLFCFLLAGIRFARRKATAKI